MAELLERAQKQRAKSEVNEILNKNAPSGTKSNVGGSKIKRRWPLIKQFPASPKNLNFNLPPNLPNNKNNSPRSFSSSKTSKISVNGRKATHKYNNSKSNSSSSYVSAVSELITNNAENKIRNKVGAAIVKLKKMNQLPQEGVNVYFEKIKTNLKGNGNHSVNNHRAINRVVNDGLENYRRWLKQPEQKRLVHLGPGFERKQNARYLQPSLANFHQLQSNFQVIKQRKATIKNLQELRNKVYLQNINEKKMARPFRQKKELLEELNQMISNQEVLRRKKSPLTKIGGSVPGVGVVKQRVRQIETGAGQSSVERNLAERRSVKGPKPKPRETSLRQNKFANFLSKRALKK